MPEAAHPWCTGRDGLGGIRAYLDGTLLRTNADADIGSLGTMVNGTSGFFVGG